MLEQKVLQTIQQNNLIQSGDKVVIGVSGGPDSMCLLDILYGLKQTIQIQIIVAHVNHQIRAQAQEETKYVQEFCKSKNIPCFVKYADVQMIAKQQKKGTEEIGRIIRYEYFEEIAAKTNACKIATAHNANDNSETVLMNILRGSAIAGLKGIEMTRKSANNPRITYIRPILTLKREEIEQYCQKNNLNPKIDKTNLENIYTRNKIRNELIPYLQKEFNPNMIQNLNRLSDLAKEEEQYFSKIVKKEYETLKMGENEKEIILDLKAFNLLPKVIKTRLLLYTINKAIGTTQGIEKINIEDILKLCSNNIGNKYLTPNKNIKILIKKGKIFFITKANLP